MFKYSFLHLFEFNFDAGEKINDATWIILFHLFKHSRGKLKALLCLMRLNSCGNIDSSHLKVIDLILRTFSYDED